MRTLHPRRLPSLLAGAASVPAAAAAPVSETPLRFETRGQPLFGGGGGAIAPKRNPPGQGYARLGPITAQHGGGCGWYGARGNHEGAMNILRNIAAERGASYVQIVSRQGERLLGLCLDRTYVIDVFACKKTSTT
jgi:hypothetical protein